MNNRGLRLPGQGSPDSQWQVGRDGRAAPVSERGMVTVELALGLLVAAGVALVLGWVVSLVSLQTACADTASQVARQLARGDDQAAADAEGNAPAGAVVTTNTDVGTISVEVRLEASLGPIGPVPLRGAAVIAMEPSA